MLAPFLLRVSEGTIITQSMIDLSDLELLGVSCAALLAIYLLRVLWGRKPALLPEPIAKNGIVVDGSNVMFWGGEPSEVVLVRVILAIIAKGYEPYVMFDANVGYKLRDTYLDDAQMARIIGVPASRVVVVGSGVVADERILAFAQESGLPVLSNDRYRDWKVQFPFIASKGRMIRGRWVQGNVVWNSI